MLSASISGSYMGLPNFYRRQTTAFSTYSDEELLRYAEQEFLQRSPVIAELMQRLEHRIEHEEPSASDVENASMNLFEGQPIQCPICLARLSLKINKDSEEESIIMELKA